MKAAALLLALGFASIQPISITDCPCGSLCENKNRCSVHDDEPDCCSRSMASLPRSQEQAPCFHVEPQTELDTIVADAAPVPELCLEILPVSFFLAAPEASSPPDSSGLPPPVRSRPLCVPLRI
ncbi:MAG: hypothetical protein HY293_09540 [Planctomycetes bacterium]|nr:hypothetical protein [Planctomycetota bacterium]